MSVKSAAELAAAETANAVQIADRIYWVGHYLEGDPFQCHCYLIEHGDQSVLIDPGSKLTFEHTLAKVEEITPLANVRYFICHHQDPDVVGALPLIDELTDRDDALIVTHWRAKALLRHYDLALKFWLIDQNEWRLTLADGVSPDRVLRFVFTPYLHFPGAFCTFDESERVLFSSDIFGGFTEEWSLVAKDESHFEALRPFHEHYMPSRELLTHGLMRIEELPLELIAPQHGAMIPKALAPYIIEKLKGLECGLYLMAQEDSSIQRLSKLNGMLREVLDTMVLYRDFRDVAKSLFSLVTNLLPARSVEFYIHDEHGDGVLRFGPATRYRGDRCQTPPICEDLFGTDRHALRERFPEGHCLSQLPTTVGPQPALLIPLLKPDKQRVHAVAVILLRQQIELTEESKRLLTQLSVPLEVAIERERIYRILELERQEIYESSIRDALTGLYTRVYMHETLKRQFARHDRDPINEAVALVLLDIDHFKQVNDTYGHVAGDRVLRRVAETLQAQVRGSDIGVRLGGEEFAVFLCGRSAVRASEVAERIRQEVSQLRFDGEMTALTVTISAGVAARREKEELDELLNRADNNLYRAKNGGRNRVITEEFVALRL